MQELLDGLSKMIKSPMEIKSACTFRQHVNSRTSHSEVPVDISEAENEISGVILGSLVSATNKSVHFSHTSISLTLL